MASNITGIDSRLSLYNKNNHILICQAEKYSFNEIQTRFNNIKNDFTLIKTEIITLYSKYLPQISNCIILNCANSDQANAGYGINHCITQEGQIFNNSDVFAAKNLTSFYPFKFNEELLFIKNVTFHNNESLQWDKFRLRKNDVIFAASKRTKNTFASRRIEEDMKRIIESIFKIAFITGNRRIYLWPIGCGVFNNDKKMVAKLFVNEIIKNIGYFKEICMVIYDKNKKYKIFNDSFIEEIKKNNLEYKTK